MKRVFFATFSAYKEGRRLPVNGMVEPMLSFFLPKVKTFILLDQPHPISDTVDPFVEVYEEGTCVKKFRVSSFLYLPIYLLCKLPSKGITRIEYKLRDFFSVLYAAFTQKDKFDLFIGLESINALAGIILRKLGKVNTVVYYVSDYSPVRFSKFGKRFLNSVYIWLDNFCVRHADFTWDVSPAMKGGRTTRSLPSEATRRVLHVPNGLFPSQIKSIPPKRRDRKQLVYLGILTVDMGLDLAIRALVKVRKYYKDIELQIIGGTTEDIRNLRKLANRLHLEKSVIFRGFIPDNEKMAEIIRHCYIGLAPYRSFPESIRWYGDAGKIRQYIASGLPVVTTQVPPLGRYIVEKGAGIMTQDSVKSFSEGILKLLSDENLYITLSSKAYKMAKQNTWENSYQNALKQMERIEDKSNRD